MSPDLQLAAIEKACPKATRHFGTRQAGAGYVMDEIRYNPLYELDACAIFEETLTDKEYQIYALHLGPLTTERQRLYISASPIRRCEAYLRTKGLWVDKAI